MSWGSVGSKSAPAAAVRPELRIHPEAAEEYEAARAWYETESPKLGMEFEAELGQIIERILESPGAGSPAPGGFRRRRVLRFPYTLVYRLIGNELWLMAFAHQSRKPHYWRERRSP